jgi:hypothetical protein
MAFRQPRRACTDEDINDAYSDKNNMGIARLTLIKQFYDCSADQKRIIDRYIQDLKDQTAEFVPIRPRHAWNGGRKKSGRKGRGKSGRKGRVKSRKQRSYSSK